MNEEDLKNTIKVDQEIFETIQKFQKDFQQIICLALVIPIIVPSYLLLLVFVWKLLFKAFWF
jgi:hypothetical protein